MAEADPGWLAPDQADGLREFSRLYLEHYERVNDGVLVVAAAEPAFAAIVQQMPAEQLERERAEGRARLERAMRGEWREYDANLRVQGITYASMGVPFGAWSRLATAAGRELTPLVVEELSADPARLTAALLAMQSFFDWAMGSLAESYVAAKEAVVREREQDLAITLDSIGDAVIATDAEGRVTRMNPVAEQLTGWSAAEARGRSLPEVFDIVSEATGERVESPTERVLREGVVVGLANHTLLVSRSGDRLPIADSGAPIKGEDGEVRGVVLVFRDMTEQHRAEAVRLRSVQLEAENRKIQEANRLKSEFLANMSHELRTPLNAIIGFAELLHDGVVPPESPQHQEFLGDILSSGQHLLQLINDVLDLSKVEAGKLTFHPVSFPLARVVGEVVSILRTSAAERRVRVEVDLDPELGEVRLDPSRLKQILYNYLSNALKFAHEAGRVVVRARAEGPDRFRLEVEDEGIGIAAADLDRLFVEFQQLDAGASKRHAGTGLGLALTRRLVEAQGGAVGVRSELGAGSTFHAVLPREAGEDRPLPAPRQVEGARPGAARVLVIEDDAADQGVLVAALTEAGYAVETAATGAQAVARCREHAFDAVTLDLLLPDTSGVEVLAAIRSTPLNQDVPVIVVTVVAERHAVAGFAVHDILPKPLDGEALLESLRRAGVSPDRSGSVLVVDDDPASLKLMRATLEQLGYGATCVGQAADGLRLAEEERPLAVVLDLVMPELDGFAFLDRFRSLPGCAGVPVIVWSVKDLTAEEHERLRSSAQAFLQKGEHSVLHELRALLAGRT